MQSRAAVAAAIDGAAGYQTSLAHQRTLWHASMKGPTSAGRSKAKKPSSGSTPAAAKRRLAAGAWPTNLA